MIYHFVHVQILRSTIGITCMNGRDVSFQPYLQPGLFQPEAAALIHHHRVSLATGNTQKTTIDSAPQNGLHHNNEINGMTVKIPSRPIEFRRKIIMNRKLKRFTSGVLDESSPMTRLLKEEEKRAAPELIPTVEVYPVKLKYTVIDGKNLRHNEGFVLVSERARIYDALLALMKVAAPNTSSSCKRVWSKRDTIGTASGDGHELVDLSLLDGKLIKSADNEKDMGPPRKMVGDWLKTHFVDERKKECEILVEVKRSNDRWQRESLELENRIKVGDFVDAQDATGKWYESIVTAVTEDTVTVHYFGWASKWNGRVRRRKHSEVPGRIAVSLFHYLSFPFY